MKKSLLLMLFAIFLAAPVLADNMWIAGNAGYENTNTKNDTKSSSTTWDIEPEIGYVFGKKWSGGLVFSYVSRQNAENVAGFDNINGDTQKLGIAPFIKYKFFKNGKFTAFLKGKLSYNHTKVDEPNVNINSYGISVTPVIDYGINDTWSFCAALNFASIGYIYSTADTTGDPSTSNFGFNVGKGSLFNVGVVYHF